MKKDILQKAVGYQKRNVLNMFSNIMISFINHNTGRIHRYVAGGSLRACHAGGPGSIPSRNKFPG